MIEYLKVILLESKYTNGETEHRAFINVFPGRVKQTQEGLMISKRFQKSDKLNEMPSKDQKWF